MRKYLSHDNLKCIVNAFVILRLGYGNSVLYGLPKLKHDKMQRLQNIAARLITGTIIELSGKNKLLPPSRTCTASCQITHRF